MQIAFFFLMIISVGYFVFEVNRHYRYAKLGRPENRSSNPRERWKFLCRIFRISPNFQSTAPSLAYPSNHKKPVGIPLIVT